MVASFVRLAVLALVAVVPAAVSAQNLTCGPEQCYPSSPKCNFGLSPVDFVFFVDVSGSMRPKIDQVKKGLVSFANTLAARKVDPTFSLWDVAVSEYTAQQGPPYFPGSASSPWFGPRTRLRSTSNIATFINIIENGLSTRNYNFRESMFEAMRMALSDAPRANGNLGISWRPNSKRVFVILTDEDNDPAEFPENTNLADIRSTCQPDLVAQGRWGAYQEEIDRVSRILIANQISTYFIVNPWGNSDWYIARQERCLTEYQYGSPSLQSEAADLSNFDSKKTLANLRANDQTKGSVQAQLLSNNVMSRVFDIDRVQSDAFVNNFFLSVVSEVSSCSSCFEYSCAAFTNNCLPPKYICGCDGIPYSGAVTDCKGVCKGKSQILKDCNGQDSCRDPSMAIVPSDCSGRCYDPLSPTSVKRVTDICGDCVLEGQTGPTYDRSCAAKPFTNPALCTSYTCGSSCISGSTTCLTDCNGTRYPAGTTPPNSVNSCGRCVPTANLPLANIVNGTERDACNICKNAVGYNPNFCVTTCSAIPATGAYTLAPAIQGQCVQDCNNVWYNKNNPSPNAVNKCGFCVARANVDNIKATTHGDDCGVCFNSAGYNATLCTQDCSNKWVYPLDPRTLLNICGQRCRPNSECTVDCKGVAFVNGTQPPNVFDQCNICVQNPPRNLTTDKDECGVCKSSAGYNATLCTRNCNNAWVYPLDPNTLIDKCGTRCNTVPCSRDCAGRYYNNTGPDSAPNVVNDCGVCIPSSQRATNTTKDVCGVCTNTPGYNPQLCQRNCEGKDVYPLNATTLNDNCGVRCGKNCVQDCKGQYYIQGQTPPNSLNRCGKCVPTAGLDNDMTGMDKCGVCTDSAGYNATYCRQDCTPKWVYMPNEAPLFDSCGVRCGKNVRDKCGTCNGTVSILNLDSDFRECPCVDGKPLGTVTVCGKRFCQFDPAIEKYEELVKSQGKSCDNSVPTCDIKTPCGDCLSGGVTNITKFVDECGVCYSDQTLRNKDKNVCGQCFEPDSKCPCIGEKCTNTTIGAAVCGNKIVEIGEECDDGTEGSPTCNSSCRVVSGTPAGVVIGAVVGAVGGAALLSAGAFIAFSYVKKNGLMFSTTEKVEMDTNVNPLYASPVGVIQNPLFNEGSA